MKLFRPDELAAHDGRPGARTLVAVNGKIYDVSDSQRWKQGIHMRRHRAGSDLTSELSAAPHMADVLERFPVVGNLDRSLQEPGQGARAVVESFLVRHPFFRRHPHPAIVHVPVGVLTTAPVLQVIALATGSLSTEWAAFCCLLAGVLALPGAILTGYFAWWINYEFCDSARISLKRRLAWLALVTGITAILLRSLVADPLRIGNITVILYTAALGGLAGLVGAVGFLGGKLTFPYEQR